MTALDELRDERFALCLEAGVPRARAAAVAACERQAAKCALFGVAPECECGAGHRWRRTHAAQ